MIIRDFNLKKKSFFITFYVLKFILEKKKSNNYPFSYNSKKIYTFIFKYKSKFVIIYISISNIYLRTTPKRLNFTSSHDYYHHFNWIKPTFQLNSPTNIYIYITYTKQNKTIRYNGNNNNNKKGPEIYNYYVNANANLRLKSPYHLHRQLLFSIVFTKDYFIISIYIYIYLFYSLSTQIHNPLVYWITFCNISTIETGACVQANVSNWISIRRGRIEWGLERELSCCCFSCCGRREQNRGFYFCLLMMFKYK